ncbi:hypothetical protein [Sphingomonas mali]|uniref:hypothetical protein n=1 Tax=Sphingomonas mali TaxID=40682 RepID=UPI001FDF62B9|nr:hypothetical protein [Sphingomonas mali]
MIWAVAVRHYRGELATDPGGIEHAIEIAFDPLAKGVFRNRVARAADHLFAPDPMRDHRLAIAAGRPRRQYRHRLGLRWRQIGISGRRHDRGQRHYPVGILRRDQLCDHPAH